MVNEFVSQFFCLFMIKDETSHYNKIGKTIQHQWKRNLKGTWTSMNLLLSFRVREKNIIQKRYLDTVKMRADQRTLVYVIKYIYISTDINQKKIKSNIFIKSFRILAFFNKYTQSHKHAYINICVCTKKTILNILKYIKSLTFTK